MYKKHVYFGVSIILILSIASYYAFQRYQAEKVNDLINKLQSEDGYVQDIATTEIPKYKNKAINPLMRLLMENQNRLVRSNAIHCLGQIKSARAALSLINFFQQTHEMPNEITIALKNIGRPAVEPLFKEYDNSDYYTKTIILGAFNELITELLNDEKTIEKIRKLFLSVFLHDNSIYVRKTVLGLLSRTDFLDHAEIKSAIKNALKDSDGDIRAIALIILQRGKGKLYSDKFEIDRLANIINWLEHYYDRHKMFPDTLNALVKENLIKQKWLLNPWGYKYMYEVAKDRQSFKLISIGKDGVLNTDDDSVIKQTDF